MTIKQAQKDFGELIAKNGFMIAGHTDDTVITIYRRVQRKTVRVTWHGGREKTLEVRILQSCGYPLVTIKRNEDDLMQTLIQAQQKTSEKFKDCASEFNNANKVTSFTLGFKFSIQLVLEVVSSTSDILESEIN